jgi:arylsulfatase A-like enzyme
MDRQDQQDAPVRRGWEKLREQIFANQKGLGVISASTQLTPWPDALPKWDSLSEVKKKIVTREADVFAAYTAYVDHEIGRVIQAVEDMGKLDNTLIIYINGDNGTSSEGSMMGTPNWMTVANGVLELPEIEYLRYYESWGSDQTYPHMAVPWAWAFSRGIPTDAKRNMMVATGRCFHLPAAAGQLTR